MSNEDTTNNGSCAHTYIVYEGYLCKWVILSKFQKIELNKPN